MSTTGISVRARFERLPSTLKGALILRGEDANPHQVRFRGVRAVPVGDDWAAGRPVPVAASSVHVAPRRDVFVPFEVGLSDLEPGWYAFACSLEVDGVEGEFDGGRRFAVAWPRGTVRRGAVKVEGKVTVGGSEILIDQIECLGDSVRVPFVSSPPSAIAARATADGSDLPVLEVEVDEAGRGRITTYPLLKSHGSLRLELSLEGAQGSLDIPLAQ